MAAEHLDDVADRLYALAPEEFTAARDAAARRAGGRDARAAVKALRRPSPSAWVVNLLARSEPDLLDQLLDLGPALAEAQRGGQGDALRQLGQQRRELVAAVTGTAVGLAGRPVAAQVRAEVEQTLEAALADPGAAEAVRSGRLVRPLSYAGLGDVDVDGAVAQAASSPAPRARGRTAPEGGRAGVVEAEQRALDAAAALDDAVRTCERLTAAQELAEGQQRTAEADAREADEQVERLERALAQARQAQGAARQHADDAARRQEVAAGAAEDARRAVAASQDTAEQARAALDRLRRG